MQHRKNKKEKYNPEERRERYRKDGEEQRQVMRDKYNQIPKEIRKEARQQKLEAKTAGCSSALRAASPFYRGAINGSPELLAPLVN